MFSVVSLAKRKKVEIKLRPTHESVVLNQGKKIVFENWQLHLKEKEIENYSHIDVSVFVFPRILFAKQLCFLETWFKEFQSLLLEWT